MWECNVSEILFETLGVHFMSQFELLTCNVGDLYFVEGSSVAHCVRQRIFHDPGVEFMMRSYADHLEPFFDVGANVGLFSFIAADLLLESAQIIAFEPDEANLVGLMKNAELKGVPNIRIEPVAVSEDNQPIRLGKIDCGLARHSSQDVIEIPCRALDEFCETTGIFPAFMKIDVEGAEAAVVKGGLKTLGERKTIVEMEFSYRDLGGRLNFLLDTFSPDEWDLEVHLRDSESLWLEGLQPLVSNICKAKHIETGQIFWPLQAKTHSEFEAVFTVLRQSTAVDASRKWEILFTPKLLTKPLRAGVFDGFELRTELGSWK